jgi:hypothetical protein
MNKNSKKVNPLPDVKMFSFHYKKGMAIPEDPIYIPIWAGKNRKKHEVGLIGDDSHDNISHKNQYYSELTGLYWAWKNNKADIWGSCHYRRFFTAKEEPLFQKAKKTLSYFIGLKRNRFGLIYARKIENWKSRIITKDEIIDILNDYDAILPTRRIMRKSVREHYAHHHNIEDLILLKEIIEEREPSYSVTFLKVLDQNRLFANNMFVLKDKHFQELMSWLFGLLEEFENRVNLSSYKDYQKRIMGFLSERLITCWFYHNNIKYKELPLIYFKRMKRP